MRTCNQRYYARRSRGKGKGERLKVKGKLLFPFPLSDCARQTQLGITPSEIHIYVLGSNLLSGRRRTAKPQRRICFNFNVRHIVGLLTRTQSLPTFSDLRLADRELLCQPIGATYPIPRDRTLAVSLLKKEVPKSRELYTLFQCSFVYYSTPIPVLDPHWHSVSGLTQGAGLLPEEVESAETGFASSLVSTLHLPGESHCRF